MKIFISIKKKWLQHRVYKYTLKYQNALSKSEVLSKLSEYYNSAAQDSAKIHAKDYASKESIEFREASANYSLKSSYQKNLSDMYLNKKLDLEEELQYLTYRKT